MPRLPQPIPYQGSKRNIANKILRFVPAGNQGFVELFAGSAALSVAAAYHKKATRFILNDLNAPLMQLLHEIIESPQQIADRYEQLWQAQLGQERAYYDQIREQFNQTQQADHFLYLLARCVKASVRYNRNGEFNQSPDNRRKGRRPASMRQEIARVSQLLKGRTQIFSSDYADVLCHIDDGDLVYLDPPYQGTSGHKDRRYYQGLPFDELVALLETLNLRQLNYILSYDGRKGSTQYGQRLPAYLGLHKLEIQAGRSTQSTLLGGNDITVESLYLSPALNNVLKENHQSIHCVPTRYRHNLQAPLSGNPFAPLRLRGQSS
ncbi:MAG TPA: DNA adenine methylase [Anaerolineae bacterium]|nr:DNA adenine methylase [Anaerolineae bacterium]